MNAQITKTYRPLGQTVIRRIGDDTLLVPVSGPPAGGRVYPVNETALIVWQCLSDGGTVLRAAEMLCEQFEETSLQQALADCQDCAQAFVEELLLEKCQA